MFLAGLLPALVMVAFLLVFGGYLRRGHRPWPPAPADLRRALAAAWAARWRSSPRWWRSARWPAASPPHRERRPHRGLRPPHPGRRPPGADWPLLRRCLADCAQVIGGVMVILGMALGLTNYLVDAGIPDAAVEWAQAALPGKFAFLLALNVFLFAAGALMEIYAAIVVLVPCCCRSPSYGSTRCTSRRGDLPGGDGDGLLCPPAGHEHLLRLGDVRANRFDARSRCRCCRHCWRLRGSAW